MPTAVGVLFLRDVRSPLPELLDATREAPESQPERQEPWRVWLHNDDYTPMEYVIGVLREVFRLGWWKATTTMLKAHALGVALVGRFPQKEAESLVTSAHARARADGWPMRLSAEPGESE